MLHFEHLVMLYLVLMCVALADSKEKSRLQNRHTIILINK